LEEYEKGRITPISTEEMLFLTKKYLPELFLSELDSLKKFAIEKISKYVENLVSHPDIQTLNSKKIRPVLKKFLEDHPYVQFIYVLNLEGKIICGLTSEIEYKKKFDKLVRYKTFETRDWFINPIKTGKIFVSGFYTSRITSELCFTISAPIRNEYEEIIGVLGLDIKFEDILKMENGIEKKF